MTPENLLREYLVDHDLRPASAKIYGAAMKKLEKNFGKAVDVESIDRRGVLALRNKLIDEGLSTVSYTHLRAHETLR